MGYAEAQLCTSIRFAYSVSRKSDRFDRDDFVHADLPKKTESQKAYDLTKARNTNYAEKHTHKATAWELKELRAQVANKYWERTDEEGRAIREANAVIARQAQASSSRLSSRRGQEEAIAPRYTRSFSKPSPRRRMLTLRKDPAQAHLNWNSRIKAKPQVLEAQ